MKLLLIAWSLLLNEGLINRSDGLSISLKCYKEIKLNEDAQFVVKISNESASPMQIPINIIYAPEENTFIDVGFEIKYANGSKVIPNADIDLVYPISPSATENLQKGQSKLIEIYITKYFFPKSGEYQIRFILHQERFNNQLKPVYSNWEKIVAK